MCTWHVHVHVCGDGGGRRVEGGVEVTLEPLAKSFAVITP